MKVYNISKEKQPNYYAIILATVRYDTKLKYAEKLLYGEITVLANKNGYCYAKNKYFADLLNYYKKCIINNSINCKKCKFYNR